MIQIDRRHFIASLGGATAVRLMTPEAKAEALESYMIAQLNGGTAASAQAPAKKFPKAADIEAQIETRSYRRGVGNLFLTTEPNGKVKKLAPMPAKPTFLDFFKLRMERTANHVLQSANRAMKTGMTEEIIMASLLHDTVHALIKTDHGYWGAQLYAPYVSEKVASAIRYHQRCASTKIKKPAMSTPISTETYSGKTTFHHRTSRPRFLGLALVGPENVDKAPASASDIKMLPSWHAYSGRKS